MANPAADIKQSGFTLIEMIITLGLFSLVMMGVHAAYQQQQKVTSREYRIAESEVELGIALRLLDRDIRMAGYGLARDYPGFVFNPRAIRVVNQANNLVVTADASPDTDPDVLRLMGTALGIMSRASSGWTFMDTAAPSFAVWGDSREDVRSDATGRDVVILMEPTTRTLLRQDNHWRFLYDPSQSGIDRLRSIPDNISFDSPVEGTLLYGLYTAGATEATQPYYATQYYIGGTSPVVCAPGTNSLLRSESRMMENPTGGDPLLACVLDFQVVLGLDTNEDGSIDLFESAGGVAAGYSQRDLSRRLKQIQAFVLVQVGPRDNDYTYPAPAIFVGTNGIGRTVNLTAEQRRYRWRIASLPVTPINIR